jgi:hypothetical protein
VEGPAQVVRWPEEASAGACRPVWPEEPAFGLKTQSWIPRQKGRQPEGGLQKFRVQLCAGFLYRVFSAETKEWEEPEVWI